MRKWTFCILFASLTQLWSQTADNSKLIQGTWMVTWTYYSSTSTPKSEGSAPLGEAIWTFNANGTFSIRSSVYLTGSYSVKNGVLLIDYNKPLMPELDKENYLIIELTDTKMELGYDIARTDNFFMTNYTTFIRKN